MLPHRIATPCGAELPSPPASDHSRCPTITPIASIRAPPPPVATRCRTLHAELKDQRAGRSLRRPSRLAGARSCSRARSASKSCICGRSPSCSHRSQAPRRPSTTRRAHPAGRQRSPQRLAQDRSRRLGRSRRSLLWIRSRRRPSGRPHVPRRFRPWMRARFGVIGRRAAATRARAAARRRRRGRGRRHTSPTGPQRAQTPRPQVPPPLPYCCPYPCPYCTLTHSLPPGPGRVVWRRGSCGAAPRGVAQCEGGRVRRAAAARGGRAVQ